MSREEINFDIDDDYGEAHEYYCVQYPGTAGLRLQNRLQRALVPAFASLRASDIKSLQREDSASSDDEIMAVGMQVIKGAFTEALALLEPEMIKALLKHTSRDGKKLSIDIHFDRAYQGNYGELYLACWRIARHNFGPAIERLMGNVPKLGALASAAQRVFEQQNESSD